MNTATRRLAAVLFLILAVIIVDLTVIQVVAGPRYRDDPRNRRVLTEQAERQRGPILARDNTLLAESIEDPDNPQGFRRAYPESDVFAHVVGYSSPIFGDTGIESSRSSELRSGRSGTITGIIDSLLGREAGARGLQLTLSPPGQEAAARGLGDQAGTVVAIDPATGAVLALYSSPSFDPNLLTGLDATGGDALERDEQAPLLNRALGEFYAPGSSFKVITTAAALESGIATDSPVFDAPAELALPGSIAVIRNADGGPCNDGTSVTLRRAFIRSCNTTFGALGLDMGDEPLVARAEAFGFNRPLPLELESIESFIPTDLDPPATAQTALGERDVRATALQMALVAAGAANGGQIMTPYLVEASFDRDLAVIERAEPVVWRRAVGPGTAAVVTDLMTAAVAEGTGRNAGIQGVPVAGKTGTPEVPGADPHAWFIGFAPADEPSIAVAVIVESGGAAGADATGGSVAAPIARAVIEAWLAADKTAAPLQSAS